MSNNTLNPAKAKCGPFFHKGGWIAYNSDVWDSNGFTGKVKLAKMELPAAWYYNVRDVRGYIRLQGPAGGRADEGFATQKLAQRGYDSACKSNKWRKLWAQAIANMPDDHQLKVEFDKWFKLPKGTTPLPEFVVGNAYGTMEARNGFIYQKRKVTTLVVAAKQALCARICGFTYVDKKTNKLMVNSMGFSTAIGAGQCPRDPARQKLVLRLASGEGKALARELVKKL
jgi:hypothetical protein